jgi:CDP-diacylglycerol--serine O-phosphatidyltransferase
MDETGRMRRTVEARETELAPPRNRLRRFRRVPLRLVLPNLVTLLALCLGLTAIRLASENEFETAVVAIIAAAVLDGLDGRIARALESTSRFGAELDSLADFVDFGVAPALLLYFWSLHEHKSLGWFAALVFAVACALRLARFNVMIDDPDRPAWTGNFFVGMPAPAGATVAMLPLYLHFATGLPNDHAYVGFEIAYVLLIALLMASRIPHFSGKRIGRVPREWFIPVLFGVMAVLLLMATFPMQTFAVLTFVYLGLIPVSVHRYRAYMKADEAAKAADAPPAAEPP